VAVALHADEFRRGVDALLSLTDGPVFICHRAGAAPLANVPARVRSVAVTGPHPAGLAGTHIHLLAPVGRGRTVWQVNAQDVIAIGYLLETGRLKDDRIVALGGSGIIDPALVRLPHGASLDEVLDGELTGGPVRVISGSILSGREAGYLGRYHNQVTVLADDLPGGNALTRLLARYAGGRDSAIVPTERFEAAMPLDILPVPLMRALAVGDVETARNLGCLELVEEDMALLSHICASGTDYGALLRETLDQIAGEG
jgi:Na+-transporting NADH:ubiquinone oxidoreductase subunit A